jgi:hypothetical protein
MDHGEGSYLDEKRGRLYCCWVFREHGSDPNFDGHADICANIHPLSSYLRDPGVVQEVGVLRGLSV